MGKLVGRYKHHYAQVNVYYLLPRQVRIVNVTIQANFRRICMALYAITVFSYLSSPILHLYIDLWKGDFFHLVLPEYNANQPHISANLNFC